MELHATKIANKEQTKSKQIRLSKTDLNFYARTYDMSGEAEEDLHENMMIDYYCLNTLYKNQMSCQKSTKN